MTDLSKYQHVGTDGNSDYYAIDPDILLVVPKPGMIDTPATAKLAVDFQNAYARKLGQKVSTLIVFANLLSQNAETRRVYTENTGNGLFFANALVVSNPLSRALGSFFIGLSKPRTPLKLFDTVEKGVEWLRTMRPH